MGEGVFEERERLRNVEGAIPYRDCAVGVEIANKKAPLTESF